MIKDARVNVRTNEAIKASAIDVLSELGMSLSDAINILLNQIVNTNGLPIDLNVPNKETVEAISEVENGLVNENIYDSVDDLFADCDVE